MSTPSRVDPTGTSNGGGGSTPAPPAQATAQDSRVRVDDGRQQEVVVCCSGGGIRSASFCLGGLQRLQTGPDPVFDHVTAVTAVSGGSYIAAAHALQTHLLATRRGAADAPVDTGDPTPEPPSPMPSPDPSAQEPSAQEPSPAAGATAHGTRRFGPWNLAAHRHLQRPAEPIAPGRRAPAFALGTPEESHLRDNTRYIAPDAPTAIAGLAALLLGIVVNLIMLGVPLLLASAGLGWLLRGLGLVGGLAPGEIPFSHVSPGAVAVSVIAITAALLMVWTAYLFAPVTDKPVLVGRRFVNAVDEDRDALAPPPSWLHQAWTRWTRQGLISGVGNIAWMLTRLSIVVALFVVLAPWVIKSLWVQGNGTGNVATVLHGLGFGHRQGHAPTVTLTSYIAALAALARTAMGKIRTYGKDLSSTKNAAATGGSALTKTGSFLRDRLAPYLGVLLVVTSAAALCLGFICLGVRVAPSGSTHHLLRADLVVVLISVAVWVFVRTFIDINHTSLHRYYRDRLAAAYAGTPTAAGTNVAAALSELARSDGPELVLCASAASTGHGDLPPGRNAVSYTFTPRDVGVSRSADARNPRPGDRGRTTDLENASIDFTLFDAVAVAGAAVSPVMGRMTRPAKRILFSLTNVRLGMWLPSARYLPKLAAANRRSTWWHRLIRQHNVRRLWAEMAGTMHLDGKWLYVTDGGHYENLGLVEALRRRPDVVYCFDASGDQQEHFATLGQAIALARAECGVDVDIDPTCIGPGTALGEGREVATTVAVGTFTYRSDGKEGTLVYGRLGVTPHHPWDVRAYLVANPAFPTTSTLSQLYDDAEFEAYRAMGEATAGDMVEAAEHALSDAGARMRR